MSNSPLYILLLEDDAADYLLVSSMLKAEVASRPERVQILRAVDLVDARALLDKNTPDAVVCDLHVPDSSGLDTAQQILDATNAPVVVLTSDSDRGIAEQAVRLGVQDYLEKDHLTSERLWRSIRYAIDRAALRDEWERVRLSLEDRRRFEALSRYAGGIAHDINNTLGIIRGYAEGLSRNGDPQSMTASDQILIATDRTTDLIKRLLQAGGEEEHVTLEQLNLSAAMQTSRAMLLPLLPKGVSLSIEADDGCHVKSCEVHVHQILLNLVGNAAEALGPNGGHILISCSSKDGQIELSIMDNGPGIPEEVQAMVMDPYFSTKKGDGHAGLGLAIIQGIMNSVDGSLRFNTSPAGTTMTCVFPAVIPNASKRAEKRANGTTDKILKMPDKPKVLLVDDEKTLRLLINIQLDQLGCEVVTAEDGEKALERFREAPDSFHLVISDVVMPNMDGPTFVGHVLKARPELPVLMVTGYSNGLLKREPWYRPEIPLLTKPFRLDVLRQRVQDLLTA